MIAIVNYEAGNIRSVQNALDRLGYDSRITDNRSEIRSADRVIIPGVGEAKSAMKSLKQKGLDDVIKNLKQPTLGICLGLQIMCRYSEEGDTLGMGIFDTNVRLFPSEDIVPHMGWNSFSNVGNRLMENVKIEDNVYYVHSYYAEVCAHTIATCDYIVPFSASLSKNNFYATQFHPEKSATTGEIILKNFLEI